MLHVFEALVVVVVLLEIDFVVDEAEGVVEIFGVVDGAFDVVDGAFDVVDAAFDVVDAAFDVVDEAFDVVDGAAGVDACRFFLLRTLLVQAAVTVTAVAPGGPAVEVTSLMGTKDEQKADAFKAIKIALQLSTSLRA